MQELQPKTYTSGDAALRVQRVSRRFGAVPALRDVSLTVQAGEIVGLLGPNGAGKTTLIRVCAGWLEADTGNVFIADERQTSSARKPRAALGIVSRDAPLYDELTVVETLRLHAGLRGLGGTAAQAACAQAIENYRLREIATRRVGVLSTGMRQRVALAVALLHAPRVLLLDEPTVGLDPDVRQHIWQFLRAAAARGVAMLLTTHYFDEAARVCDRVHLLVNGVLGAPLTPRTDEHAAAELERAFAAAVQWEISTS